MIDVERLVEAPWKQRKDLAVASDQQAEHLIETNINHIVNYIKKPFRLSVCYGHTLFNLTSDEYTKISDYRNDKQDFRIEPERVQRVGMEIMKRYGLDEEIRHEKEKPIEHSDNTQEVITTYPSQTINGLVFIKVKTHNPKTKELFAIEWGVSHKVALMKFNPIEALRKSN